MSSGLVTFDWEVPSEGHRWHDVGARSLDGLPDLVLVERAAPGLANRRRYDPFAEAPALYREFAKVKPTQEGIVSFADKWGPLYGSDGLTDPAQPTGRQAELFSSWVGAVSAMKHAVELWDILRGGTEEQRLALLQRRLVRERDTDGGVTLYYDTHPDLPRDRRDGDDGYSRVRMAVASDRFGDEGLSVQRIELSRPARVFLCRLASRNLQGQVSPRLFPDAGLVMKALLPVMASIRLVPAHLLAALWLQFAYAMSSDKEQRLCPGCGEWFELEKRGRSDRAYCTDACRKRVYRERREKARQLFSESKSVKEIAKALDADLASVKRWVKGIKGTNTKG